MSNTATIFHETSLYRVVSSPLHAGPHSMPTDRSPKNMPWVVDNVWEMVRPENLPSRRTLAFASTRDGAAQWWSRSNGDAVGLVRLSDAAVVMQLKGIPDAMEHPDVARILRLVDGAHESYSVLAKNLLCGHCTGVLLGSTTDTRLVNALKREVTYWSDLTPVAFPWTALDGVGEITFHAPGGYCLDQVDA